MSTSPVFCRDQQPHSIWLCDLMPGHPGVHQNNAMALSWANEKTSAKVGCRSTYRAMVCSLPPHRGGHRSGAWGWSEDGTVLTDAPAGVPLSRLEEMRVSAPGDWMVLGSEDKANQENQPDAPVRSRVQRKRRKR
jgi:hypothetical protein